MTASPSHSKYTLQRDVPFHCCPGSYAGSRHSEDCPASGMPSPVETYWRCLTCGGTTTSPLTDESRCKCADIYDQQWVRVDSSAATYGGPSDSEDHTKHDALALLVAAVEQYLAAPIGNTSNALVRLCNVKDRVKLVLADGVDQPNGGKR